MNTEFFDNQHTICAPATTTGGAIGVIRVSGKEAITNVGAIFSKNIYDAKGYTLHHGTIIKGKDKLPIDDVLVSVFRAPHSYTGEDSIEISHHGSAYIQREIMQLLINNGCKMALPGEFTKRAFLNGKLDLSQAESVADLIASRDAKTHSIAMSQLRGGFSSQLAKLHDQLLELTSLLELELDFTEQDVEFADRQKLYALCNEIERHISRLTDSFKTGNALKNGIAVAIIGAPNVGKSTLLNTLLHDDRAIVSDIQGTTRDIIEECIELNGITFRFIDTAGIRKTEDKIEQMGIERSMSAVERAQIVILMTEPNVPFPTIEVRPDQTVIQITNKTDEFQALTGRGVAELEQKLLACVPNTEECDIIVTNIRHYEALSLALIDIRNVQQALSNNIPGDLIAEDLRLCLSHLAEITGGQITTSDVLANIFRNFCIGK